MIKVIALDAYGTIFPYKDDSDEDGKPNLLRRRGVDGLFERCRREGIAVVCTSDAPFDTLEIDLEAYGIPITKFNGFYKLAR